MYLVTANPIHIAADWHLNSPVYNISHPQLITICLLDLHGDFRDPGFDGVDHRHAWRACMQKCRNNGFPWRII